MKAIRIHTVAVAAVALLASAPAAPAQVASPEILNVVELRQLVMSAEPGDHARLSAHFGALAARYADDAARHTAMSRAFGHNPNRAGAVAAGAHCARLATLGTQSAATLRELAEHHERLAVGTASTVPAAAARFEDGEGAPAPTDQELRALAGRARTPADHRALAEYFMTVAEGHTMEAEHHTAMAQAYRGNANRRGGDPAVHCDRLVKLAREAAKEALAAETVHTQLATIG